MVTNLSLMEGKKGEGDRDLSRSTKDLFRQVTS